MFSASKTALSCDNTYSCGTNKAQFRHTDTRNKTSISLDAFTFNCCVRLDLIGKDKMPVSERK